MNKLFEESPKYEVVQVERAFLPDDSIKVDSERLRSSDSTSFNFIVNGRSAGTLTYYRRSDRWLASIKEGYLRGSCDACGFGDSPDEAVQDALSGGLHELQEAVVSAKRVKRELGSKKTTVALVEKDKGHE